ncbi:MAG: phosphonoacetaldehyde reductase [Candidatus Wildermuthbacteria bacterium]|nr:phosphonoacetaldehyde reductase [Candidatus Wildermuthbacteria bacterium]
MTKEFFGKSAEVLAEILKEEAPRKIFLVVDKNAYGKSGAEALFSSVLKNFEVAVFSEFQENPKIENIQKGIEAFRSFGPDIVLAVGGGSALDVAKSVNALAVQEGDPLDFVLKKKELKNSAKPLIAVPTTAGTGSEATRFAVVYIGGIKHSLDHSYVLPAYSIIDPQLTFSLPPRITASTGMDALAQAIEAYWSNKSTEESKKYAKEAISLILPNIALAVNSPNPEARSVMSKGAHLAGKAINISFTTACHAISYSLTVHYGIPHGHAVGFTLPAIIKYNAQAMKEDALSGLLSLLGSQSGEQASDRVSSLMQEIGLETKLSQLGVSDIQQAEDLVVKEVNLERLKNNPRILAEQDLRAILRSIQ